MPNIMMERLSKSSTVTLLCSDNRTDEPMYVVHLKVKRHIHNFYGIPAYNFVMSLIEKENGNIMCQVIEDDRKEGYRFWENVRSMYSQRDVELYLRYIFLQAQNTAERKTLNKVRGLIYQFEAREL